ncbi:hypothetical protein HELRODRAFT_161090 [Helobdella robusta]|uniref:Glycoside hydrolase family 5 domain-containing protein n=1 Tax=Helobdella robusta TaxID=6412 RepID=T1ER34_HELRO|nr:hypothetical protein HELRODRAFT_161090 [Helobdella robusta]ESO01898.1 hypothetical protein HELRODRAFT_161090 [Helobdella robusta]
MSYIYMIAILMTMTSRVTEVQKKFYDGLFPSILRIGGSPADYSFFDLPVETVDASGIQPKPYVITKQDVINLLQLTSSTNTKLLFDFNVQVRFGYNWDPSNAIQFLNFAAQFLNGTDLLFELGNEPDCLLPDLITPERLGEDFAILQKLLSYYQSKGMYKKSFIVGPDVVSMNGLELQYITSYYFRGDVATYKDYLNPQNFANLAESINNVKQAVSRSNYPATHIWIGETSDAWHSGTPNVSDRFVSAFLWLDKLGLSALMGVKAVMRQTLYGYYYSLLDLDMNPNPNVLTVQKLYNKYFFRIIGYHGFTKNDVTTYKTVAAEKDPYVPYNCARHSDNVNKQDNNNNYNNNKKNNTMNDNGDIDNDVKKSAYNTFKNADTIHRLGAFKLNNASSSLPTFRISMYGAGSVTLYGLNLHPTKSVDVKFVGIFKNLDRHVYLMEPDNDYKENKKKEEEKYSHKDLPILSK